MDDYNKRLIEDAPATYGPILTGKDSRLRRGDVLWEQFENAAAACEAGGRSADRALGGMINELAVAKIMADDRSLAGPIVYEPSMLASGRKIDFVADRAAGDKIYV